MTISETAQPRHFPESPSGSVGAGRVPQAGHQQARALFAPWKMETSITGQWPGTQEPAESAQHPNTWAFLPVLAPAACPWPDSPPPQLLLPCGLTALLSCSVSGGELFERIIDEDFELTERECIQYMRQISEGVQYIHKQGIVHLDLKPENIMCVNKTGTRIKLIDFGLARKLGEADPPLLLSPTCHGSGGGCLCSTRWLLVGMYR